MKPTEDPCWRVQHLVDTPRILCERVDGCERNAFSCGVDLDIGVLMSSGDILVALRFSWRFGSRRRVKRSLEPFLNFIQRRDRIRFGLIGVEPVVT